MLVPSVTAPRLPCWSPQRQYHNCRVGPRSASTTTQVTTPSQADIDEKIWKSLGHNALVSASGTVLYLVLRESTEKINNIIKCHISRPDEIHQWMHNLKGSWHLMGLFKIFTNNILMQYNIFETKYENETHSHEILQKQQSLKIKSTATKALNHDVLSIRPENNCIHTETASRRMFTSIIGFSLHTRWLLLYGIVSTQGDFYYTRYSLHTRWLLLYCIFSTQGMSFLWKLLKISNRF